MRFDLDPIEALCRIPLGNILETRDALSRCTRDGETRWIYLLAASRSFSENRGANPRRFFSFSLSPFPLLSSLSRPRSLARSHSLSIFIKMPEKEKEAERTDPFFPSRGKYENPYSRAKKISVI